MILISQVLSNFTMGRDTCPGTLLTGMKSDISTHSIVEHRATGFFILLLNLSQKISSLDRDASRGHSSLLSEISQLSSNKFLVYIDESNCYRSIAQNVVRSHDELHWFLRHLANEHPSQLINSSNRRLPWRLRIHMTTMMSRNLFPYCWMH